MAGVSPVLAVGSEKSFYVELSRHVENDRVKQFRHHSIKALKHNHLMSVCILGFFIMFEIHLKLK